MPKIYTVLTIFFVSGLLLSASSEKKDCLVKALEESKAAKKICLDGAASDRPACIKNASNAYGEARKRCS